MRALLTLGLLAGAAVPLAPNAAEDWQDFAMVSTTMGTQMNRLCAGADNSDIGCPSYAPSLTTAGDVSVTGNLSAVKFIGDGSALTGLPATTDRIVSGTSSIIVSQSGHISFTTAGTERMVINASGKIGIGTREPSASLHVVGGKLAIDRGQSYGAQYLGNYYPINGFDTSNNVNFYGVGGNDFLRIKPSGAFEFTEAGTIRMYIAQPSGNVGIGTISPQAKLQVSGGMIVSTTNQTTTPTLYVGTDGKIGMGVAAPSAKLGILDTENNKPLFVSDTYVAVGFGYGYTNNTTNEFNFGVNAGNPVFNFNGGRLRIQSGSTERLTINATTGNVGIGVATPAKTLDVSGTAQIVSRTMIGGTATPSATLQVSGSLLLAGSDSTTCSDAYIGILRRNPTTGRLQVCK